MVSPLAYSTDVVFVRVQILVLQSPGRCFRNNNKFNGLRIRNLRCFHYTEVAIVRLVICCVWYFCVYWLKKGEFYRFDTVYACVTNRGIKSRKRICPGRYQSRVNWPKANQFSQKIPECFKIPPLQKYVTAPYQVSINSQSLLLYPHTNQSCYKGGGKDNLRSITSGVFRLNRDPICTTNEIPTVDRLFPARIASGSALDLPQ